jgi:hypothetical protein
MSGSYWIPVAVVLTWKSLPHLVAFVILGVTGSCLLIAVKAVVAAIRVGPISSSGMNLL